MRIRQWLLSSVVCGGILTCGGVVAPLAAQAAPLEPNSAWAVSKIAAPQAGGLAYCAIARRFGSDIVLTLARNAKDESSVAIDFQKSFFEPQRVHDIELNAGYGQKRNFSLRPVSERAVVIHLGKDYAFYDALNRSDRLDIKIGDQPYRFYMGNVAEGQHKMNGCLATLISPAAGSVTPVATINAVPPQPVAEPVQAVQAAQNAVSQVVPAAVKLSDAERDETYRRLEILKDENIRLKNDLNKAQGQYREALSMKSGSTAAVAEMRERLNLLEVENRSLVSKLKNIEVEKESLSRARAQANSEKSSLQDEMLSLNTQNKTLENQIAQQKQEIVAVQNRPIPEADKSAELAEIARLRVALDEMTADNRRLEGLIETQREALAELKDLRLRQQEDGEVIASLRERLASLEAEKVAVQRVQDDKGNEIATLKARIAALEAVPQQDLAAIDRLNARINALVGQNKRLQDNYDAQSSSMEKLRQELAMAGSNAEEPAVINQLNDRLMTLESQNKILQAEEQRKDEALAELKQQVAVESNKTMELARIAELEETLSVMERDNNRLRTMQSDKAQEVADLQARLQQQGVAAQTRDADDISREQLVIRDLGERLNGVMAENERLRGDYDTQSQALSMARDKLEALKAQVQNYQGDSQNLSSLSDDISGLQSENQRLRADMAAKEEQISALSAQLAAQPKGDAKMIQAYADEIEALRSENQNLVAAMERKDSQFEALNAELAANMAPAAGGADDGQVSALLQQVELLKAKNSMLSEDIKRLNSADSQGTDEAIELLAKLRMTEVELREVRRDRDSLAQKLEVLRGREENQLYAMSAGNWELEEATRRYNEAEREIVRLGQQIDKMRIAHEREVKELEYMLFNPEIAEQAQIARLLQMEEELSEVRRHGMAALGEKLKESQSENAQLRSTVADKEGQISSLSQDNVAQAAARARAENGQLLEVVAQKEAQIAALSQALKKQKEETVALPAPVSVAAAPVSAVVTPSLEKVSEPAPTVMQARLRTGRVSAQTDQVRASSAPVDLPVILDQSPEDSAPMPLRPAVVVAKMADVSRSVAPTDFTVQSIQGLLDQAGIALTKGVKQTGDVDASAVVVYNWDTAALFGSAEQSQAAVSEFDQRVKTYLNKTEQRCGGDFAAVPVQAEVAGDLRVSSYDIACVADHAEAAASLVFFNRDGVFTAIAHETDVAAMDEAMSVRDRLSHALLSAAR